MEQLNLVAKKIKIFPIVSIQVNKNIKKIKPFIMYELIKNGQILCSNK